MKKFECQVCHYVAEGEAPEVSILKSVDEDGESILCAIEDQEELEAVNNLIMDQLYEDSDED